MILTLQKNLSKDAQSLFINVPRVFNMLQVWELCCMPIH